MASWTWSGAVALACVTGCVRAPSSVVSESREQVMASLAAQGQLVNATLGGGRVRYLGFSAEPEGALPGDQVRLVHYWSAVEPLDRPYRVFVHALVQGAFGLVPHGDHDPVPSPDRWPVGRVVRDEHALRLPEYLPGDRVELRVGLYLGDSRLPVDEGEKHDGTHRIRAGSFPVAGQPIPVPTYRAVRLGSPPTLDGELSSAEWGDAAPTTPFVPSHAHGRARLRSEARLAWDPEHLYLAFDLEDPDIQGTLLRRDDPIYREEAVEIFIDADCDRRSYVELQASPRGTQFDASFTGPRQQMNLGYQADFRVGTQLDGTLESPDDRDRGWRSEWAITAASIPGLATPLETGARLCLNLFRVSKDRQAGGTASAEETAWSPPLMGDFHNPERFGELRLAETMESP